MTILWLKALHIFFMVCWMAGIFYLPRLFVYHAQATEQAVKDQFKIMERRLWLFITPFAFLTLLFGVWLMAAYGSAWLKMSGWLHAKLLLVTLLYGYHFYLYRILRMFAEDIQPRSPRYYRILNEAPVLAILLVIILAVVKPF